MKTLLNLILRITVIVLIPLWVIAAVVAMIMHKQRPRVGYKVHVVMFFLGIYILVHWLVNEPYTFVCGDSPSDSLEVKYRRWCKAAEEKFEVQP
jgi:hypothetical protein